MSTALVVVDLVCKVLDGRGCRDIFNAVGYDKLVGDQRPNVLLTLVQGH